MKVGIDLSSTNTGLVILSDDNKLIGHGNFKLGDTNRFVIASKVSDMINTIMCKRLPNEVVNVGIELADFKNANITNRFNLLTGMIISELGHGMEKGVHTGNTPLVRLKLFNSNEGQRFLLDIYKPYIQHYTMQNKKIIYRVSNCGDYVGIYKNTTLIVDSTSVGLDKRGLLKLLSSMGTHKNCKEYDYDGTEDECDAYCIAYFLSQLRDRTQMHQEVKTKKVQEKKSKVQVLRDEVRKAKQYSKLKDILIKYKSMEKLTKAQQRALEKAEMELKNEKK